MNDSTTSTPLHTGRSLTHGSVVAVPEIISLEGGMQLRARGSDGAELVIPHEMLPALARFANSAHHELSMLLDRERRTAHHPALRHPHLAADRPDHTASTILSAAGPTSDLADGDTYLMWNNKNETGPGWSLRIHGVERTDIGFAAWNDVPAQDNLVAMLTDPESCLAIAAIMNSDEAARLTARVTAASLRAARSLPSITLDKVRAALTAGNVPASSDTQSRWGSARLRVLTVKSGGKAVPVAVAITPSYSNLPNLVPLTDAEKSLPWAQRSKIETERRIAAQAPWMSAARTAMANAGWRVVDLPSPAIGWGRGSDFLWVTRLDADTWAKVAAAAAVAAPECEMSRGGVY